MRLARSHCRGSATWWSNSRTFEYDAVGNRTKLTDRNGRVTEYSYDNLYRLTQERWKDGTTTVNTQDFAYDAASQLTSAGDNDSSYTYTYDNLGRPTLIESNNGGPQVKLTQSFDAVSNRTGLSAQVKIGAGSWTNDFQNAYTYDNLDRMTRVEQNGVTGGHAVAEKRVDFAYNAAGQFTSITRYDALAGGSGNLVATTSYTYDGIGRLTDLTHAKDTTTIADDTWTYDAFSRVTQFAFTSLAAGSGTSNYSYDDTGQLTSADHDYQTDESYSYDENGNRTMSGYSTGTNNRLTSDGTFNYEYDNEGNRTKKTTIATGDYVEYAWNHHNELTSVTFKSSSHTVTKKVEYEYDVFGRRTRKRVDANGDGRRRHV